MRVFLMFSIEPRRRPPMPHNPFFPQRRPIQRQQGLSKANLMSLIQDTDGNLDLEKITTTMQQVNQIYGQFSPMISRFIKR